MAAPLALHTGNHQVLAEARGRDALQVRAGQACAAAHLRSIQTARAWCVASETPKSSYIPGTTPPPPPPPCFVRDITKLWLNPEELMSFATCALVRWVRHISLLISDRSKQVEARVSFLDPPHPPPLPRVHGRIDFGSGRRQNGRTILPSYILLRKKKKKKLHQEE